jgi:hypothetical protein
VSRAIPARWGFAATASTTDLRAIAPLTPQNETLWSHHPSGWLLNMTLLIAIGAVLAGCIRWRTRLGAASPISHGSAGQRWLRVFRRPEHHRTLIVATGAAVTSMPVYPRALEFG